MSDRRFKVLCLHGHPGNSEAMEIFLQYFLGQGINAIAPDLRGYGNCKAVSSFTMLDHIQDLWDLLVQNNEAESNNESNTAYLIVGWSLGGILAIELALRAIELQARTETLTSKRSEKSGTPKIIGLILIASSAKPRSSLPKIAWWEYVNLAIAVILHRILGWLNPKSLPKPRWHIEWFGKRSLIKYLIQQHTQFAYDRIATTGARAYWQTSRYAQSALMQALRDGYDRNDDLAKIEIPCLAIAGEQDRHITADSTAETAKLLPNCEFICYPNTAHLLPWEIGDRLLVDINKWCDRHLK